MASEVARTWLGRLLSILLTIKVLDSLLRGIALVRVVGRHDLIGTPLIAIGLSVSVYSFLAITLWVRPAAVFPLPSPADPSQPPATARHWIELFATAFALYLIVTGLILLSFGLLSATPTDLGALINNVLRRRETIYGCIQIAAGVIMLGFASGFIQKQYRALFVVSPEEDEYDHSREDAER